MRSPLVPLASLLLAGCATLAPNLEGPYVARGEGGRGPGAGPPAVAFVGDVGIPRGDETRRLARRLAQRLRGAPGAPVVVLGDVFYVVGLRGACGERDVSLWRCDEPGPPQAQLEAVLGPYRDALDGNPVVALAGNHDVYGGDEALRNACELLPGAAPGWRYLARGCGLDAAAPVATLDLGGVVLFALDSEPMIRDAAFLEASVEALRREIRRARTERPGAWRVVAAHHPLETHGAHNGATLGTALLKDWYFLRKTLLYPLTFPLERLFGQQDVYELRYRRYRRALYRLFRDEPVDVFAAGHDHSLQHVRIDHPGVPHQIVSGAGANRSPVQRYGQDLLWSNRLARALGLGEALPAPRHELRFGLGGARDGAAESGYGFAVLVPEEAELVLEFHDPALPRALHATAIRRPPAGP